MKRLVVLIFTIIAATPAAGADSALFDFSAAAVSVERFAADRAILSRFYDGPGRPQADERIIRFLDDWRAALERVDFERLDLNGRVDFLLLRNEVERERREIQDRRRRIDEVLALLPFADAVWELHGRRRAGETIEGRDAAARLEAIREAAERAAKLLAAAFPEAKGDQPAVTEIPEAEAEAIRRLPDGALRRAAVLADELKTTLAEWRDFRAEYDPEFTWWTTRPYAETVTAWEAYEAILRRRIDGERPASEAISGDPAGREALEAALREEFIAYGPEELIEMARAELAWCEREMRKAAREMGHGEDWRAALEDVKTRFVPPGEQPELVRELAIEAIRYVEERDLITVPELAKETWRMEMMSPERQKVNPFFLGGEVIRVSYPTAGMTHEEKLMSMRGNNPHFSRATVHHELIPGHHLQRFMRERYRPHRALFSTPFWIEGWAFYWEMLLWDLDFPRSPEDRVGMLFWRMHRCARVIFSLGYHLGRMTAEEAVDYLVERVGHERENAVAEVRRSFTGDYPPLYQAAYFVGAKQFRALRRELVENGEMTNKAFHDAVLRLGPMPVEMARASLIEDGLDRDYAPIWRFQP